MPRKPSRGATPLCFGAPYSHAIVRAMPAKKTVLTDEERAKRIRETAREIGTDDDPKTLDRAVKKVIASKPQPFAGGTKR